MSRFVRSEGNFADYFPPIGGGIRVLRLLVARRFFVPNFSALERVGKIPFTNKIPGVTP